ncbi:unnamed protein product [Bursaphelenchus okinawaensis]|uniref:Uncharacterized protein n=1 Tax=Bursaphelenchus okinawaensis TaxID=465554 RepID=A0A811KRS2_9BILA|nr:unnamed protein product [Bursaphelenchus okinawaensis]CAG9108377.1 unnamed protein product [Bursaphelenchus okinawaensis]
MKLAILFFCLCAVVIGLIRPKRQTYYYPEELRKYARPHAGTKFYQGTVGRYAPQDWPSWYTRTIFKWSGDSRMGPYHPNDVRYLAYQKARMRDP